MKRTINERYLSVNELSSQVLPGFVRIQGCLTGYVIQKLTMKFESSTTGTEATVLNTVGPHSLSSLG